MDNHCHLAEVREGGAGQRSHGATDEETINPSHAHVEDHRYHLAEVREGDARQCSHGALDGQALHPCHAHMDGSPLPPSRGM